MNQLEEDGFELLVTFELKFVTDFTVANNLKMIKTKNIYSFTWEVIGPTSRRSASTHQFTPGDNFLLKVFKIKKGKAVDEDDCLHKLASENSYLMGEQGIKIAYEQIRANLPKDKWLLSFDQKNAVFWRERGGHILSEEYIEDSALLLSFERNENFYPIGVFLLCFCDLTAGEVVSSA